MGGAFCRCVGTTGVQVKFCKEAILLILLSLLSNLFWQVIAFNETPVRNLKHLANMVEKCTDPYLRFDLEYQQVFFPYARLTLIVILVFFFRWRGGKSLTVGGGDGYLGLCRLWFWRPKQPRLLLRRYLPLIAYPQQCLMT